MIRCKEHLSPGEGDLQATFQGCEVWHPTPPPKWPRGRVEQVWLSSWEIQKWREKWQTSLVEPGECCYVGKGLLACQNLPSYLEGQKVLCQEVGDECRILRCSRKYVKSKSRTKDGFTQVKKGTMKRDCQIIKSSMEFRKGFMQEIIHFRHLSSPEGISENHLESRYYGLAHLLKLKILQ